MVTEVGLPPSDAASLAPSTASATVPDSRRAISASLGKRFTDATAMMMPVMATTARTSMRVKPTAPWCGRPRVIGDPQSVPVADIRGIAFSTARVVGAEAEDVDLALHAGIEVLVVAVPRVLRQAVEILLPVAGHRVGGG